MTLFWKESFAAWRSMHFLGHFMVAAVLLGAHVLLLAVNSSTVRGMPFRC